MALLAACPEPRPAGADAGPAHDAARLHDAGRADAAAQTDGSEPKDAGAAPCTVPCDDQDPCTEDRCEADRCRHVALPDGAKCGAQQFCHAGSCGACSPGSACELATPRTCHAGVVSCASGLPECTDAPAPSSWPCDDGDPCTADDRCDGNGSCASGVPHGCLLGDCASAVACDGRGGCLDTYQPQGAPCQTEEPCEQHACDGAWTCAVVPGTQLADGSPCGSGICCAGACRPNDAEHCGSCGNACAGKACRAGTCCTLTPLVRSFPSGESLVAARAVDLDGDGALDVVALRQGGAGVSVMFGDGLGGLSAAVAAATTVNGPRALAVGDLDGDGTADLVVANNEAAQVVLNHGRASFVDGALVPLDPVVAAVALGDLDRDGRLDLVAGGTNGLCVAKGAPGGGFGPCLGSAVEGPVSLVVVADLNADGKAEVVSDGRPTILLGRGDGTFDLRGSLSPCCGSLKAVGDVDGDGTLDLVLGDWSGFWAQLNHWTAGVWRLVPLEVGAGAGTLALVDWNEDRRTDLVFGTEISGILSVGLQQADGTFVAQPYMNGANWRGSIATGDLDRDGYTDLVLAGGSAKTVQVVLNRCD